MRIESLLTGKSREQKARIKAAQIAASARAGKFDRGGLRVEILSVEAEGECVTAMARAWSGGVQVGFGPDGSVDVERFRFFNPPVLVDDPAGNIVREWTDEGGGHRRTLLEDPERALRDSLARCVSLVGRKGGPVVQGKVGRTTSTFYPHASDGDIYATGNGWATVHGASTGTVSNSSASELHGFYEGGASDELHRGFYHFDTSAIPDSDVISSATLAMVQTSSFTGSPTGGIVLSSAASDTSLASGDFNDLGTTEGATRQSIVSSGTTTWTFNATGLSWISKTGYTKLGLRLGEDIDDSSLGTAKYFRMYTADQTGTTSDPTLTVVHAAPAPSTDGNFFLLF